jgi:UDPglucose--hexose-1-phosphate uridylyltransferase
MMSEIRRDLVKNSWVAVAADRALKPNDFPIAKKGIEISGEAGGFCPFCEGNEAFTPPEITAWRTGEQKANMPGWLIRSIPNKFSEFRFN